MSYEEIDKASIGADVFTGGAEGRYARPSNTTTDATGETSVKKKKAPKVPAAVTDNAGEPTVDKPKKEKKVRKTEETGVAEGGGNETPTTASAEGGETVAKPKKKRAPKDEAPAEGTDAAASVPADAPPTKKKKSKAPKVLDLDGDSVVPESLPTDDGETTIKVKKTKKSSRSKPSVDPVDEVQINTTDDAYNTYSQGPSLSLSLLLTLTTTHVSTF